jgi:hypothetical protein
MNTKDFLMKYKQSVHNQIDSRDYYWLWIAYEPNMDLCLMICTYQEKEPSSYMLSVLQGITEEIWQKDHFHRWWC